VTAADDLQQQVHEHQRQLSDYVDLVDHAVHIGETAPPPPTAVRRLLGLNGTPSPPAARRTSWTAVELLAEDFPEARWAVEGLIAEGLTLFAGAPKVGKSWAAINLGVAVATGGKAFGKIDVEAGDVLYLALEDTPRRLKSRLRKVLTVDDRPARLTVETACETLTKGGADRITGWLDRHPDARLVVVDVFARVRGESSAQSSAYDSDYTPMALLKSIADKYSVAILVVHHTRKAASDDFLDTVSGTQGLAGAADAVLVLKRSRGQADAVLYVTGRDIDEAEYAMSFSADLGAWQMLAGPAGDYALSDTRRTILQYLRDHGSATPKQVADALGIEHNTAKQRLWQMAKAEDIDAAGNGLYMAITDNPRNPERESGYGDQGGRNPGDAPGYDGYGLRPTSTGGAA